MPTTPETKDILNTLRSLKPTLQQWRIRRLRVFGSVAHGTAGPDSDIDLIADFETKPGLLTFAGIKADIEEKLGRPVDLFTEQSLDPHIKEKILREAQDV